MGDNLDVAFCGLSLPPEVIERYKVPPVTEVRDLEPGKVLAVLGAKSIWLAGGTFTNDDDNGSARQEVIKTLEAGMLLRLVREPSNAFDPNAIAIFADDSAVTNYGDDWEGDKWRRVGYVPSVAAKHLAPAMDECKNWDPKAVVLEMCDWPKGKGFKFKIGEVLELKASLPGTVGKDEKPTPVESP